MLSELHVHVGLMLILNIKLWILRSNWECNTIPCNSLHSISFRDTCTCAHGCSILAQVFFLLWPHTKHLHVYIHYSKKLKKHVDIMIFIECYPLKRCQGCVKLIASKVNCFLNITDLSEVQLCMSSNSWTWECPHTCTKDGADHVP